MSTISLASYARFSITPFLVPQNIVWLVGELSSHSVQLVLDLVVFTLLLPTGSTLHSPFPSLRVIEKSMLAVSDIKEDMLLDSIRVVNVTLGHESPCVVPS